MLFNELKVLQQFIVPDILNNSSLHAFSKGYIYRLDQMSPFVYQARTIITRKGKEGKQRMNPHSFYVTPLILKSVLTSNVFEGISFVVTKDNVSNILNANTNEFVCYVLAKFSFLESFRYVQVHLNKTTRKTYLNLRDLSFSRDDLPIELIKKFESLNTRKHLLDELLNIEQFCRHEIQDATMYNLAKNQLYNALQGYAALIKEKPAIAKNSKQLMDCLNADPKEVLNTLDQETKNVLQKYENCSYWF